MDTDTSHVSENFDDNIDEELKIEENENENNDDIQDDLIADDELFDDDIQDEEIQSEKMSNEIELENNDNPEMSREVDHNKSNEENINMKENQLNDENIPTQSMGINNSNEILMENKNENSDNSINSVDDTNSKNLYEREVDIDEGEIVIKPLNDLKKEEYGSSGDSSTLKGSRRSLYCSGYFGSNPQIARSNKELYKNIVQKRYPLGNKDYEVKPRPPITEEIVVAETEVDEINSKKINNDQQSSTSKDSINQETMDSQIVYDKREKVKYIESNMVDIKPTILDDLTDENIAQKSDRWLCPSYLNNEKYKKNFEVDMNNLSVQVLAQEFLSNDYVDLETRAYLLESVFPILCISLEKLLMEIDRRKIIEKGEKPSEFVVERTHNAVPRDVPFDSINWLAQYLYRNNPKYSNYADITSTPYLKSIKSVMTTLKAKLFEMDINKRALERADELARKREEERQQKIMEALYIEKKKTYSNLLASLFKQWVKKLWRKDSNLYLTNFEIIDCFNAIYVSYESSKESDNFKEKLNKLIDDIIIEFDNIIRKNIENQKINDIIKDEEIDDKNNNNENKNEDGSNEQEDNNNNNNNNNDNNSNNNVNKTDIIVEIDINENNELNNNNGDVNDGGEKNEGEHLKEDNNEIHLDENDNEKEKENNSITIDENDISEEKDKVKSDVNNSSVRGTPNKSYDDDDENDDDDISNKELHISQEIFMDTILNTIIEWKIEEVSQLLSLIIENAKLQESEMNRIFDIICGLPGLLLLGDEWKKFIEVNTEKLELPLYFVDNSKKNTERIKTGEDGNEMTENDHIEEFLTRNSTPDMDDGRQKMHEVKLLELRRNIKIVDDVCTIIISDHNDRNFIPNNNNEETGKPMTNNIYDDMEKERFDVTPRFNKSVENLINFLNNNQISSITEEFNDINSEESFIGNQFQSFVKDIISAYSTRAALFTFYQLNCLKLMEIEEAKRQEIKRKEEEILQKRIKKIKLIFKSVDKEDSGCVLVKQLNAVFENVPTSVGDMEFLKYPLEVQDMFVYLKIPVMARALLTKTITDQEFVDHVLNVCASLIPEHFDTVLQLILDSLSIDPEEEEKQEGEGKEKDIDGDEEGDELTAREKDQNEVLKMIWTLMKDPSADISQICDLGLTWTMDTIAKYNNSGLLIGDVVINDLVVDNTGSDSEEKENNDNINLIYISVDNTGKESVENIDKQFSTLNNPKSSIIEAFQNNMIKITNCNESSLEEENSMKDTLILNVPFTGKDDQVPLGVISLQLKPKAKVEPENKESTNDITNSEEKTDNSNEVLKKDESLEFSKEDINFIKSVGKVLGYAIEHIVHRERSNAILESCSTYILDLLMNSNVNLYLVEKVPSKNAIEKLGKKKNKDKTNNSESEEEDEQPFSNEDYTFVMYVSDKPTEEEKKKISKKNGKKKTNDKNIKNKAKFQKSEKDNILKKITKKDKN
ncbi:hypothetical protein PIROE2DRAFT_13920, partial [Piromyces sp. E2]